jgi:glutamyl-Q tRNA(Asp) synthetase
VNAAKSSTATATTGTASEAGYVGRFAPSPTGDLHLGSLYTAAASYLDARAHGGRWLVRMEDVDRPRVIAGSADRILATLEAFGFEWHGEVLRQSGRDSAYAAALEDLSRRGLTFACSCSRLELIPEPRYPGHCRRGPRHPDAALAVRLRVDPGHVQFMDCIQGAFRQDVALASGDLILKRRDGWFAYLLAVVVDDAHQGVTKIVRGADLLDHTAAQMYLQRQLGLRSPAYAHVPALIEPDGSKLSKSARSVALDPDAALPQLLHVFELLGLAPPASLTGTSLAGAWRWAVEHWDMSRLARRPSLTLAAPGLPSRIPRNTPT